MTLELIHETTISTRWACAIEYGDYTGLENGEEQQLEAWIADYPAACFEYSEDTEFARDEISGLMADCCTIRIYLPRT